MILRSQSASAFTNLPAKSALLEIVRVRFRTFERKFGRLPKPDEPLFFDSSKEYPVKADLAQARAQILEAARQAKVDPDLVLAFLGFSKPAAKSIRRTASFAGRGTAAGHQARTRSPKPIQIGKTSAWTRFLADQRLHRRYRITPEELTALSRVAFMGQVRDQRTYLAVLKGLRSEPQS